MKFKHTIAYDELLVTPECCHSTGFLQEQSKSAQPSVCHQDEVSTPGKPGKSGKQPKKKIKSVDAEEIGISTTAASARVTKRQNAKKETPALALQKTVYLPSANAFNLLKRECRRFFFGILLFGDSRGRSCCRYPDLFRIYRFSFCLGLLPILARLAWGGDFILMNHGRLCRFRLFLQENCGRTTFGNTTYMLM